MKFLIDQQSPEALAGFIQSNGDEAHHVRELGLTEAEDKVIWQHAAANGAVIISKDEDFYFMATVPENKGKLLWIRTGNCRTKHLLEILKIQFPRAMAAFESGSVIVEIQ